MKQVTLGWGRRPLTVRVPRHARVLNAPVPPPAIPWRLAVDEALSATIGAPTLRALLAALGPRPKICVLVPDETRKDVAAEVLPHLLPHLGDAEISVGVATGKHPPPSVAPRGAWSHRADDPDLVPVGTTAEGTEVAFPRAVLDADLRILVGEVRPHYFAGYAGGAKTLFPGVAGAAGIWHNHQLKATPGARLGQIEGNACRADMEAAAAMAGPSFVLNIVRGLDGRPVAATAGDPVAAHRAAVALARPVFEVEAASRAQVVVVSDKHPVTMNLYQACKLLPPAGALLAPSGTVIICAALHDGVGPVETINEKIYRLGSVHALPTAHRVVLVSTQPEAAITPTFADWAPDLETALKGLDTRGMWVIPYGGEVVPRIVD